MTETTVTVTATDAAPGHNASGQPTVKSDPGQGQGSLDWIRLNVSYFRTIPGILKLLQVVSCDAVTWRFCAFATETTGRSETSIRAFQTRQISQEHVAKVRRARALGGPQNFMMSGTCVNLGMVGSFVSRYQVPVETTLALRVIFRQYCIWKLSLPLRVGLFIVLTYRRLVTHDRRKK